MRRVVVTGLGLLTSLGNNVSDTWSNLLSCHSGIQKINNFETSDLPCKIAGFIDENPNNKNYMDLNSFFESKELKRNDRFIIYGLVAAKEAIVDAGVDKFYDRQKLEVSN